MMVVAMNKLCEIILPILECFLHVGGQLVQDGMSCLFFLRPKTSGAKSQPSVETPLRAKGAHRD